MVRRSSSQTARSATCLSWWSRPIPRRSRHIASFQNSQFKLAEMATEIEVGQAFVDRALAAHVRGDEIVTEVSMAKWWTTELLKRVTSQCLQLHGGYGFMSEFPVSTDYADAAVQSIYAGTNEIMKVIIARRMGLDNRE